jgi:hypothetical protein
LAGRLLLADDHLVQFALDPGAAVADFFDRLLVPVVIAVGHGASGQWVIA